MQEKIRQYYLSRLDNTKQSIERVRKDIYYLGTGRLLIVVCTIVVFRVLHTQAIYISGSVLFIGIALFLFALQKWNSLQKRKYYLETSTECDKN